MTPTEDNYGMTSTTEYKPGTCCAGTVKILGKSYRAMDDSNAPKCFQSRFANCRNCFFPHGHCRGVLGIVISPD